MNKWFKGCGIMKLSEIYQTFALHKSIEPYMKLSENIS